jgi:hypothetical protein
MSAVSEGNGTFYRVNAQGEPTLYAYPPDLNEPLADPQFFQALEADDPYVQLYKADQVCGYLSRRSDFSTLVISHPPDDKHKETYYSLSPALLAFSKKMIRLHQCLNTYGPAGIKFRNFNNLGEQPNTLGFEYFGLKNLQVFPGALNIAEVETRSFQINLPKNDSDFNEFTYFYHGTMTLSITSVDVIRVAAFLEKYNYFNQQQIHLDNVNRQFA